MQERGGREQGPHVLVTGDNAGLRQPCRLIAAVPLPLLEGSLLGEDLCGPPPQVRAAWCRRRP